MLNCLGAGEVGEKAAYYRGKESNSKKTRKGTH